MADLRLLEAKERVGQFEIQQVLHRTGSAATYKAGDSDHERTVALKFTFEGASNTHLAEAHLTVARAASRLAHDNIACTYGGGKLQGALLQVSEYHEGLSLGTRFSHKENFAWTEVLEIAGQVCAALDYANSKGVPHNRLHPGNVQVGWDGSVKLLDFAAPTVDSSAMLVHAGLPFMSPEQVAVRAGTPGDVPTAASNLFSLAAMLYQMILGTPAFSGDTPEQTRDLVLSCKPTRPGEIKPSVPKALEEALLRALARDPGSRFAAGTAFYAELEKHRSWNPSLPPRPSPIVPPRELFKPVVIGVKAVQPVPAEPAVAGSGSFRAKDLLSASASHPASQSGFTRIPVQSGSSALQLVAREGTRPSTALNATSVVNPTAVLNPASDAAPVLTGVFDKAPAYRPVPEKDAKSADEKVDDTLELRTLPTRPIRAAATPRPRTIGSKVDDILESARDLWKSTRRLQWAGVGAGLFLVVALVVAATVDYVAVHHKNQETAAAPNPAIAQATPPAAAPSSIVNGLTQDPPPIQSNQASVASSAKPVSVKAAAKGKLPKGKPAAVPPPAAQAIAMGSISFQVVPADAQIEVDGAPYVYGGNEPKAIAAGVHMVTVSRAGYASESRTVQVMSGARSDLSLRLAVLPAVVAVNSNPPGAFIYVDGKDSGKLSPVQLTLSEGSHVVTLRKDGFLDAVNDVSAKAGQTVVITADLRQTSTDPVRTVGGVHKLFGGTPAGMVRVRFLSAPKGAQVQVNGQLLDRTTPVEVLLKPGDYEVDFMASGYKTDHRVISVTDGKKMEFSSSLESF